jgi:hypothetical protein
MSHDHKPSIVLAELCCGSASRRRTTPTSPASWATCRWPCCATASARTRPGRARWWSCGDCWCRSGTSSRRCAGARQSAIRDRDGRMSLEALARLLAALDSPLGARARRRGGNAWPGRWRPPTGSKAIRMTPCRSEPPDLHELARRVRRLVPCWQDPTRFYQQRDDLVDDLHRLARSGSPRTPGRPAEPSPRERRLVALARSQAARIAGQERLLAQAAQPRPRRRRAPDGRQMMLIF